MNYFQDIARPQLGKWQGCVTLDTNNEWLVSVTYYVLSGNGDNIESVQNYR